MPGLAVNVTCGLCVFAGAWVALSGSPRSVAAAPAPERAANDVQLSLEVPAGAAWLEVRADYAGGATHTWRIALEGDAEVPEVRRLTFLVGT